MNKINAQFSDKKYEISKIESIERISKSRHMTITMCDKCVS